MKACSDCASGCDMPCHSCLVCCLYWLPTHCQSSLQLDPLLLHGTMQQLHKAAELPAKILINNSNTDTDTIAAFTHYSTCHNGAE